MNCRIRASLIVPLALFFSSIPSLAHHSPQAEFNLGKTITLKGKISSVDWINPHVYIHLDVKDDAGKATTWNIESLPTRFLHKSGITKEQLMGDDGKGQIVTMEVYPAKDPSKLLAFTKKITYPDGHFYDLLSLGSGDN